MSNVPLNIRWKLWRTLQIEYFLRWYAMHVQRFIVYRRGEPDPEVQSAIDAVNAKIGELLMLQLKGEVLYAERKRRYTSGG